MPLWAWIAINLVVAVVGIALIAWLMTRHPHDRF